MPVSFLFWHLLACRVREQPGNADRPPSRMSSATASPSATLRPTGEDGKTPRSRRVIILTVVAAVLLVSAAILWVRFWPFGQNSVVQDLAEASDSRVQVQSFRAIYFPHPGCTLRGLTLIHGSDTAHPLIAIEKLTIEGSYLSMLARHVSRITAEGLRIFVPSQASQPFHTQRSTISIGEMVANGAILEFAGHDPDKPPLRFDVPEATLRDIGWKGALAYRVHVHNPEPPGEVTASGKFGVWNQDNPGQTPVSGKYRFEHADLSVFHGIAGMLSSGGEFAGTLGHIDISGTTDTPDFKVTSGGHPVELIADFSAYVDATHGDTFLKRVDAHFGKTRVVATGSIAGTVHGKGKTALIDFSSDNGRIEDMVGLFVKASRAPMSGAVTLQAKVEIPPGREPFLKKFRFRGNFGIGGGEFSKPSTQQGVNKLSAGARGEKNASDPQTALTDLTGRAVINNGVTNFSDLSFGVPGASARMQGTYDLINYKIDLRGQMKVQTKISNTESGAKAVLLKMIDPFFKKRKKGEILPVRIGGTYDHPTFGLDLKDKKAQQVDPPSHPAASKSVSAQGSQSNHQ